MEMRSLVNKVFVNKISYSDEENTVTLYFTVDEVEKVFTAVPKNINGIELISSSDELSDLLMSLMPYEPEIYKKLYSVVWSYIKNEAVFLPIKLIDI